MSAATFGQEAAAQVWDMRWLICLVFVLCLVDFRFGIRKAKKLGEPIRRSNAWRRTVNKFMDYCCWLFVSGVLTLCLAPPLSGLCGLSASATGQIVSIVVMLFAITCEVESIFKNWAILKGIDGHGVRHFIAEFITLLAKRKDSDVGSALEETIKDLEDDEKENHPTP